MREGRCSKRKLDVSSPGPSDTAKTERKEYPLPPDKETDRHLSPSPTSDKLFSFTIFSRTITTPKKLLTLLSLLLTVPTTSTGSTVPQTWHCLERPNFYTDEELANMLQNSNNEFWNTCLLYTSRCV